MHKRVAITGGAGFLGSHIVDYFVDQGEDVVVVDNFSEGKRRNLEKSLDDVEVRRADLRSAEETGKALGDADIVVHLAANIGGIGYFHDIPADIISENDLMDKNVLDAAVEYNFDRVVYASSSMVFEEAKKFPVKEEQLSEIPPPQSAYGFQKLAGEYYCRSYKKQYDVDYSIFRPFNAVGTREPPGEEVGQAHVIPDFVKKIIELEQHPLEILGDGNQVRSFTNVRDIARGVHKCAFREEAENEGFNLGLEEGVRMKELARKIWDIADREQKLEFDKKEGFEHDVQKRVPSSEKARETLDWKPRISLEDSLEEYIDWYRKQILS